MIKNPALGLNADNNGPAFFTKFFAAGITFLLIVGSVFFFFNLVMGAIQWIGSGGDKGAVEAARSRITNALIGMVVLFSVFAVINLVAYFFGGINLLQFTLSPIVPGGQFTEYLYTPPYQQYTTTP
jgi:hypothetical protein